MLPLLLALSLAQVDAPQPADAPAAEPEEGAEAQAPDVPPVDLLPSAEPGGEPGAMPPITQKQAGPAHSTTTRVLVSGASAVAASFASLGITLALTGANPRLDTNFANAMLAPILMTGVGYAVHAALGGKGAVMLAWLVAFAVMGGAAGIAAAIDGTTNNTPVYAALIGTLPAAAGAIWVMEATTPKSKRDPQFALLPNGFAGVF
jgi:hypothetical protein